MRPTLPTSIVICSTRSLTEPRAYEKDLVVQPYYNQHHWTGHFLGIYNLR